MEEVVVDVIADRSAVERATVARNLRAIRERKRLSQSQAAELCDMSDRHYGEIERGEANFTLETRVKLCAGLKITIYDLYGDLVFATMSDIV